MIRKIVQIATARRPYGSDEAYAVLFAVADDGTLWEKDYREDGNSAWYQVEALPSIEEEAADYHPKKRKTLKK